MLLDINGRILRVSPNLLNTFNDHNILERIRLKYALVKCFLMTYLPALQHFKTA